MPRENIVPFILQVVFPWMVALAVVAGAVAGNAWVVHRVYFAEENPEDFRGRAEATVTDRDERGGGGPNPPAVRVWVDYTAGERTITGARLRGDGALGHSVGDTLVVAYHPEDPRIPFTLETLDRPGPISKATSLLAPLLFGALFVWAGPAWAAEVSAVRTRWWTRRLPRSRAEGCG
ncbi:DUF3592 domain-containing protein [Nocardiopsis ganjiahuensis]|uniref:DUF3592 domain-containing protein n=1 Tax=Nocardiopsis ganjiahuensis TaxID=239984 RepID=UPI00034AF943|nr:DUF3592 domain-containing protein [Nocardiopsis ganjiahuensis]